MSTFEKKLKLVQNSGLLVLDSKPGNYEEDGHIQLDHGYYIQAGDGYAMLWREDETGGHELLASESRFSTLIQIAKESISITKLLGA